MTLGGARRRRSSTGALLGLSALVAVLGTVGVLWMPAGTRTSQPAGSSGAAVAPAPRDDPPVLGVQTHVLWSDQTDEERLAVLRMLARSHVGWVRMDLGWCALEEQGPGRISEWYLERADRMVDAARDHGLQVLMTLWCTPTWASSEGDVSSPPRDVTEFARVAGAMARHFRGRVSAWEVWNEPNLPEFWHGGDADAYVRLLRTAYPAIKEADAQATVVFGGVSYNDATWIERAYEAGAHGAFDVMATHPYMGVSDLPPSTGPSDDHRTLRGVTTVHDVMRRYDDDAPIWFTEFGWSAHDGSPDERPWARGVTPEQQAEYLVAAIDLVAAEYPYVTHMFWYTDRVHADRSPHDAGYGLLTADLQPTPAYRALRDYLTIR